MHIYIYIYIFICKCMILGLHIYKSLAFTMARSPNLGCPEKLHTCTHCQSAEHSLVVNSGSLILKPDYAFTSQQIYYNLFGGGSSKAGSASANETDPQVGGRHGEVAVNNVWKHMSQPQSTTQKALLLCNANVMRSKGISQLFKPVVFKHPPYQCVSSDCEN